MTTPSLWAIKRAMEVIGDWHGTAEAILADPTRYYIHHKVARYIASHETEPVPDDLKAFERWTADWSRADATHASFAHIKRGFRAGWAAAKESET